MNKCIKTCMVVTIITSVFSTLSAQLIERWVYTSDSTGYGFSIVQAVSGDIYVAGELNPGNPDLAVVKLDTTGIEKWMYVYGGGWYAGFSIIQGADGNLYVAGYRMTGNSYRDILIMSIDTAGNERWIYTYNGQGNNDDEAWSIIQGADGNLYVTGYSTGSGTSHDIIVISIDTAGNERWVYTYNGGNQYDEAYSIACDADGNIYVAGHSRDYNSDDFVVISLDTTGNMRWIYRYEAGNNVVGIAYSVIVGLDGNVYACGFTNWTGQVDADLLVVKLDAETGAFKGIYFYNGPNNYSDWGKSITQGDDGNLYIAGEANANAPYGDILVVSLDTSGVLLPERWTYVYNGGASLYDEAFSVVYGANGDIYVSGQSEETGYGRDFTVISFDTLGNQRWVYVCNSLYDYDNASRVIYGVYDNIYSVGTINNRIGVVNLKEGTKLQENEKIFKENLVYTPTFLDKSLVLNSRENLRSLKIELYNAYGRCVLKKTLSELYGKIFLNDSKIRSLPSGIYFLKLLLPENKINMGFKIIK